MEILKQIEAKDKVISVIESCTKVYHTFPAEEMVKLYYNKFEDFVGKEELLNQLLTLREQLQNV